MCGWVGIFGDTCGIPALHAAGETMASRGPDGYGEREVGDGPLPFGLAHRRLAILDPSPAGAQPMVDDELGISIAYNGEIYNYPELRKELESSGHRFHSDSDTEVLLRGFSEWSDGLLSRIEGMFSFAIVDENRGRVLMARDRTGIKPLYYGQLGDVLVAGSAPRALLALRPEVGASVDRVALAQLLALLWIPHPRTPWKGITKLAPATAVAFERGQVRTWRYWEPALHLKGTPFKAPLLLESLDRATERQLLSDVPLGVLLSGGLDSTLLMQLMSRHSDGPLEALTASFDPDSQRLEVAPDDLAYARKAAGAQSQAVLHEVEVDGDASADLDELLLHFDDPVADPAAISLFRLVKRSPAKVLLSGVGGEELFAGYPRHLALAGASRLAGMPSALRRAGAVTAPLLRGGLAGPGYRERRNAQKLLRSLSSPGPAHYWRMMAQLTYGELVAVMPDVAADAWSELDAMSPPLAGASLADALRFDRDQFLPNLNLAYVDKAAMAAGVEVRVPLLDEGVLATLTCIDPADLIRDGVGKAPLRDAARGIVDDEIIDRPKAGFGGPVRAWFRHRQGQVLEERIRALGEAGVVETEGALRILADARSGRQDTAMAAWALVCLQGWQQRYGAEFRRADVPRQAPQATTRGL